MAMFVTVAAPVENVPDPVVIIDLYHYTNADGLLGILVEQQINATPNENGYYGPGVYFTEYVTK